MTEKKWYKKWYMIPGVIASIAASILGTIAITVKAQDKIAENIVESREPYFRVDHKPIYDTLDSIKQCQHRSDSATAKMKESNDKMYFLLQEMASSDEKTRAINRYNEDKQYGVR